MNLSERFYTYTYSYPNGVPFYVGKGTKKRIENHMWDAKAGRNTDKFHIRIIRKLLKNNQQPTIKKIVDNVDEELAFLVEQELIAKYGKKIDGTGILTNNTDGGEGASGINNIKRTPEQIEAMRQRATGVKQSEESKLKKSLKLKGYKQIKATCSKCGTIGGEIAMKRWHFEKCTGIKNYRARARVGGKRYHVGYYVTLEEVEIAKKEFIKKKLGV